MIRKWTTWSILYRGDIIGTIRLGLARDASVEETEEGLLRALRSLEPRHLEAFDVDVEPAELNPNDIVLELHLPYLFGGCDLYK